MSEENLKLFLRIKPSPTPHAFESSTSTKLQIKPNQSCTFDHIFTENSSPATIFAISGKNLINHFLQGYNSAFFVYGQTGTGKTHTMGLLNKISNENCFGIVAESLKEIFGNLDENCDIFMSFSQIYMEEIRDLLNPEAKNLIIREKLEKNKTFIMDLTVAKLETLEEAFKLINAGLNFRKIASQVLYIFQN